MMRHRKTMMKRWTLSVARIGDVLLYNGKKAWILASIMTVLALTTWTPTAKADSIAPSVSKTLELTQAQLTDLLSQCDKDGNWIIKWFDEKQCKNKFIIAESDKIIAENTKIIAQLDTKSAQLDTKLAQINNESAQIKEDIAKLRQINSLIVASKPNPNEKTKEDGKLPLR